MDESYKSTIIVLLINQKNNIIRIMEFVGIDEMKLVKKRKDGSQKVLKSLQHKVSQPQLQPWKILVVDDEHDIHAMTELNLKNFEFEGRSLHILQAKSGQQAKEILRKESNIAVILVDIVMETDDAGLDLVNYIRGELKNNLIRIVVRTGQPGMHLEKTVIEQYDIDDYKNKSELNIDNLRFTIRTTLKVYRDLIALELMNQHLEKKVQERTLQLERQNQALQDLNRDKNEFLAIAAHDLKNPLHAIKGSTEIIEMTLEEEQFTTKPKMVQFLSMISVSAERMSNLVTNLLDVNAIETGQFAANYQQTDVYPILEKIIAEYREKARIKQIELHVNIQATSHLIYTDANLLYQILDNLLSNAVKYSPFHKQIFVRLFNQSQTIQIEIQDQGQGFSEEDQTKLFGKFSRLSAKPTNGEHSTGLGLFIVKKLVDALHGQIDCKSQQGQGATFILTLPIKPDILP